MHSSPVCGGISSPRAPGLGEAQIWHQTPGLIKGPFHSPVQEDESLFPPLQKQTYQMLPNH